MCCWSAFLTYLGIFDQRDRSLLVKESMITAFESEFRVSF